MNAEFLRKLPTPKEIKEMYPLTEDLAKIKAENDEEIRKIFTGESDKFILIIGPTLFIDVKFVTLWPFTLIASAP